jgi:hypothetical protein
MKKKPSVPPIPPLPIMILREVQDVEEFARLSLMRCGDSRYYNAEQAVRILRTCVVESLDIQIEHYETLENYQPEWVKEIRDRTISATVGLVGVNGAEHWDFFEDEVIRTVRDYLKDRAKPAKARKTAQGADRKQLRDAYLRQFNGEVKILDICWAAGQRYREWKRWIKNELKDGSKPDLAFRRVLSSSKRPEELSKTPRHSGWK